MIPWYLMIDDPLVLSCCRTGVYLDRHVISNLSLTEPRTMRSLVSLAASKTSQAPGEGGLGVVGAGPGPDIKIVGKL